MVGRYKWTLQNFDKLLSRAVIMKQGDIIVGVERVLEDCQESSWNKKKLRWTITHNNQVRTRQHEIELEMTMLSSQRVVRVDGDVRHRSMCSFGYRSEFDISGELKGAIVQDTLTFELFINGKSFTECARLNYSYKPPELKEISLRQPKQQNFKPIAPSYLPTVVSSLVKETSKQAVKSDVKVSQPQQKGQLKHTRPIKTELSIKDMQNEAMRILIAQKREKNKLKQESNC